MEPTTASTWKQSAAQDRSQSANIVDSLPVRIDKYKHICNIFTSSGGKSRNLHTVKKIFIYFFTKAQLYTHSFTGACCPTGVKLYRRTNNTLRVYWRSLGPQIYNHTVELYGTGANYTCMAAAGSMYCDIQEETCGDVYTVVAAPVEKYGSKVTFCQPRTYSGGNKIQGAYIR